jgi:hypothetical protein
MSGGSVHIGWRKTDDRFEVMSVYKKALEGVFHSPDFMQGNSTPLEELFQVFRSGKHKNAGFGPAKPVPSSYGFVFVDEVERKILDWNGYTTLATVMPLDLGYEKIEIDPLGLQLKRREELLPFVVGARHLARGGIWTDIDFPGPFTAEMYDPFAKSLQEGERTPVIELKLNFPAWEVVTLPENSARSVRVIKEALSSCTELTEAEEKVWARAAKRATDQEAELAELARPSASPQPR